MLVSLLMDLEEIQDHPGVGKVLKELHLKSCLKVEVGTQAENVLK